VGIAEEKGAETVKRRPIVNGQRAARIAAAGAASAQRADINGGFKARSSALGLRGAHRAKQLSHQTS